MFNALSALSHKLFLVFLIEFYALCVKTHVNLKYRNRICLLPVTVKSVTQKTALRFRFLVQNNHCSGIIVINIIVSKSCVLGY